MKRPASKDKALNDYADYLEQQIEAFKTHTKKKFYLGIQRQLDLLGDEMLSKDFKVSMKKTFDMVEGKAIAQDSGFDGFFDMLNKGETIIKAMDKFENQVFPKEADTNVKKPLSEDSAENYLKKNVIS